MPEHPTAGFERLIETLHEANRELAKIFQCRENVVRAVLWRNGKIVSGQVSVADPPPGLLNVAPPRVFLSLEQLVEHLTGEPQAETFVLQQVTRSEPRAAIYLHIDEAVKLLEGAL